MTKKERKELIEEATRLAMAMKIDLHGTLTHRQASKLVAYLEGHKSQAKYYDIEEIISKIKVLYQEFPGVKSLMDKKK